MGDANFLAPLAMATFPLVMLGLFMMYRPAVATTVSLLLGELLLPPLYTLPITPSWISKWLLPPLVAGLLLPFFARGALRNARPFRGIEGVFLAGLVANFMTYWTNREPIWWGPLTLPGLQLNDLFGDLVRLFVDPWIVFFLGRILFKTSRDLRSLSRMLVIAFLAYSLLILFEVRMSPCLNRWIYGYQASGFEMTRRWGGFRPTVFFKDGLPLASMVLTCVLTAVAMAKARVPVPNVPRWLLTIYALAILVICKSTGVLVYAVMAVPLIAFAKPRRTTLVAATIALAFLVYPFVRSSGVLPLKELIAFIGSYQADRAGSLNYRFSMEQGMLDHTLLRPLWGWGAWGRNMVYNARTGDQMSVPDGGVILLLSTHGYIGAFAYYLPFGYTVLRAARLIKRVQSRADRVLLSALAINCAIILFDLIINAAFFPLYMMLFGALYSLPGAIASEEKAAAAVPDVPTDDPAADPTDDAQGAAGRAYGA